tara:strand:+ start:28687 stop:28806 length:120 start_codon:yes stop_codon:yes gene_type:complete
MGFGQYKKQIKKWLLAANVEDAEKAVSQIWFEQQLTFTS